MLTAIYAMLRDQVPYQDLGPDHFDRCDKTRTINRLVCKLKELGCEVQLTNAA
jgi:hypothetical protein